MFEEGRTIGKPGSENGIILDDQEYGSSARITLERGGGTAPFAITCGVYGLLVHTRFLMTEVEARSALAEMRLDLARIVDNGTDSKAAQEFLVRFPN